MKRVLVILGLVAASGAGAYGQTTRSVVVQDVEVFHYKSIYRASMCADRSNIADGTGANNFMMRPTRPLANNWFEAEVAPTIDPVTKQLSEPVETIRINAAQLCYVKPMTP